MRKVIVTWVCDQCGAESEPLRPGITFNWSYDAPRGWLTYAPPRPHCPACGQQNLHQGDIGLGSDPLLKPDGICHFCSLACKEAWLPEPTPPPQPPGGQHKGYR